VKNEQRNGRKWYIFAREVVKISDLFTFFDTSFHKVQHMQKAMELMNIKLTNVISDILGKSGQAIISATISSERDVSKLTLLADPRCKSPKEIIDEILFSHQFKKKMYLCRKL